MEIDSKRRTQAYISARREHPAWRLLAAQSAPSVLSCLQTLFEERKEAVDLESALAELANVMQVQAASDDFEVVDGNYLAEARKELRAWIRMGLVAERQGQLMATDALQKALAFVEGLGNQLMTSTASRLSTVQREIENLEASLNPDPRSRAAHIERKIKALEGELKAVQSGNFTVLDGNDATESIREVYHLATSLRADFRRVEDSYRNADKRLRQSIISEQQHRGEVVDKLLDSHDQLLDTAEGRVFHNFHQQLSRSIELEEMGERLKTILHHQASRTALDRHQQQELRWLKTHLVDESEAVIKARARSERDVKGFLKTGLAAEHHRVGQLLQELQSVALDVNWSSQAVRRSASPLPPVAVACAGLPLIARLRFKLIDEEAALELDLRAQQGDVDDIDADFWSSFNSLDRQGLLNETHTYLQQQRYPVGIAELAKHFEPKHDLESIALWLSLAREVAAPFKSEKEQFDITIDNEERLRYRVPKVALSADVLVDVDLETFEG
ncbi:MAG: DUF3375 domain-containing protein [Pseudomonadales bacterium]